VSRGQSQSMLVADVQKKAAPFGRRVLVPTPACAGLANSLVVLRRLEAENLQLRQQAVDLALEIQALRNVEP
jgi:hypothetical protein